ncbi:hypothetical protein Patl1_16327 [Pistacia atlantica]|uniref:Uncharacterized protein n=1 Tax=Pistacia atlantica TaxID=434234 RepID=A0ACC1B7J1_9ROSI|nr:hypothetical protein Patl1_16327 [Pistacia atlantica]
MNTTKLSTMISSYSSTVKTTSRYSSLPFLSPSSSSRNSIPVKQSLSFPPSSLSTQTRNLTVITASKSHDSNMAPSFQGRESFFRSVFANMEKVYLDRNPTAKAVLDHVRSADDSQICYDHIAFRTFGVNGYGIDSIASFFLDYGYTQKEELRFPAKKLKALWFSPPSVPHPDGGSGPLPRVFISELLVDQMSPQTQTTGFKVLKSLSKYESKELSIVLFLVSLPTTPSGRADSIGRVLFLHFHLLIPSYEPIYCILETVAFNIQEIIKKYTEASGSGNKHAALASALGSLTWGKPLHSEFQQLARESEYAAWTLVNGYAVNHVTISTHRLKSHLKNIKSLNEFIEENGFRLNSEGGVLKVSPDGLLLQSSTVADSISFKFSDGVTESVPCSYIEFAERLVLPQYKNLPEKEVQEFHRRDGFEVGNADKIFESTSKEQLTRRAA